MKTKQHKKPAGNPVKNDAGKSRLTPNKTSQKTESTRIATKPAVEKIRRTPAQIRSATTDNARSESRTPGRTAPAARGKSAPAKTPPGKMRQPTEKTKGFSAQDEAAKPRRTGTKLTRLLDLNVVATPMPGKTIKSRPAYASNSPTTQWLLYCRPGFEKDCAQEAVAHARAQRPVLAEQPDIITDSGYSTIMLNEQSLNYSELIFARQLMQLHNTIAPLPERDRLTPLLLAINALPGKFGTLWLEVPDTNEGKTLSAFIRRFSPLLEEALRKQGKLVNDTPEANLPRLHIFFPDKSSALIASSNKYNSAASLMGIVRQSMPAEAPSRSTLKLAEAIEVFLDKSAQSRLLRSGMTAVDLGAAPGGWTWQMVKRGIRVTAVDNGDMKGVLAKNPMVEHLKEDGFKFTPRKSVDWLICDMVEKPGKVAELIGNWFVKGWCKHAIFNLKLPMKQRVTALDSALGGIRKQLNMEGINYKLIAKQLYHDREEITVFLSKIR